MDAPIGFFGVDTNFNKQLLANSDTDVTFVIKIDYGSLAKFKKVY